MVEKQKAKGSKFVDSLIEASDMRRELDEVYVWCGECHERLLFFYVDNRDGKAMYLWSCLGCNKNSWLSKNEVNLLLELDEVSSYMWFTGIEDREEAAKKLFLEKI